MLVAKQFFHLVCDVCSVKWSGTNYLKVAVSPAEIVVAARAQGWEHTGEMRDLCPSCAALPLLGRP